MEENNNQTTAQDETVPMEQVNQVMAENGNQNGGYKDLLEQDSPVPVANPVPPIQPPVQPVVQQPPVSPGGQSGSLPLTQQPEEVSQPVPEIQQAQPVAQPPVAQVPQQTQTDDRMKFLQFQCKACEFKAYVNLEDDKLKELPDKLKCISCGKKKAMKRRILDMTLHGYADYVEPTK